MIKSYESARWFTGDHLDAYAIKITDISISELSSTQTGKWYQVDSLPEILDDAVSLIGEWQYEIPWFPSEEKLRNDEFYVYPWSIYCHGVKPSSVQLIFTAWLFPFLEVSAFVVRYHTKSDLFI